MARLSIFLEHLSFLIVDGNRLVLRVIIPLQRLLESLFGADTEPYVLSVVFLCCGIDWKNESRHQQILHAEFYRVVLNIESMN